MLVLNVTRKELEARIIKIIEDFNGNPLGKKSKRLSIVNQSLKTLLHGSNPQHSNGHLKNNEHNLDAFFSQETSVNTPASPTWVLSESYNFQGNNSDSLSVTFHNSEEEAYRHLMKMTLCDLLEAFYSSLTLHSASQIASKLTNEQFESVMNKLSFDWEDVAKDIQYATEFLDLVEATRNLKAIEAAFKVVIESDGVQGHHNITEIPSQAVTNQTTGARQTMTSNVPNENSNYRDILCYYYGDDIGSVVGCGLDRAGGHYMADVQNKAIEFYENNLDSFKTMPIGARRELIANFVRDGSKPEGFV